MSAANLPDHIRTFIVRRLATYVSPAEIRDPVREEFDLDVSRATIGRLNPENTSFAASKELADLFWEARDHFQRGPDDVGIVWKPYRLRKIDAIARALEAKGEYQTALAAYEQAAKEVGGAFEPRRRDAAISLETLRKYIEGSGQLIATVVHDPELLRQIDDGLAQLGGISPVPKSEDSWQP